MFQQILTPTFSFFLSTLGFMKRGDWILTQVCTFCKQKLFLCVIKIQSEKDYYCGQDATSRLDEGQVWPWS